MSENFEASLRELHARAADAHAGGAGFPTSAMVTTARRNRRVRTGALAAVATVAVVGVAWAGSAVAGLGNAGPVQPAEPSVTAAPGTYTGPACGTAIGEVPVFDEPPLAIEVTLDDDLLDSAEALTGRLLLAATDGWDFYVNGFDGMLEGLDYAAVQDGVVVGYGGSVLVDGTWQTLSGRQGVTALGSIRLQPCESGASTLPAGDYELVASMPVTAAAGDQDDPPDSRTILGGPWPFTVQESGWSPIDITAVPVDVPGAEERVLRAEAHADGQRWRATVELNDCQDMYRPAREALIAAGYAVVSEESDPERPFWSRGVFRDGNYDVELETSNETGGGCFRDYLVTAR